MKSKEEIEDRLLKLSARYKRQFIEGHLSKIPQNCRYNAEVSPKKLEYKPSVEHQLAPRISHSLVVIQEDLPIRVCTYSSNGWNGDICDDDSVSKVCPYFESSKKLEELEVEFAEVLKDDKLTLEKYPDIASLQWVSGARVWSIEELPPQQSSEIIPEPQNDEFSSSPNVWKTVYFYFKNLISRIMGQK